MLASLSRSRSLRYFLSDRPAMGDRRRVVVAAAAAPAAGPASASAVRSNHVGDATPRPSLDAAAMIRRLAPASGVFFSTKSAA